MKAETEYQWHLRARIEEMLPGCIVLKNDSSYLQGIPDLSVFYEDRWAMLEVKTSKRAAVQPNQPYYVDMANRMSFAAFIYPENEEEVLGALQQSFTARRPARSPLR